VPRRDFDPAVLHTSVIYPLLTSVVVPRPIAWVSTRSAAGVDNLAPHSFFTVSAVDPPVVQFTSVGAKDSLRNARETGEFVVALTTQDLLEQVNATATDYPPGISEFEAVGLEREPSAVVAPFRVAASPVNIECRVLEIKPLGNSTIVFGSVVWLAVDDQVFDPADDLPRIDLLRPVARLGRNDWTTVGDVSDHQRVPFSEL
jgi:flavin reductase (DIM6/NTAB) family NADH-FMN oxidoreductase RutF